MQDMLASTFVKLRGTDLSLRSFCPLSFAVKQPGRGCRYGAPRHERSLYKPEEEIPEAGPRDLACAGLLECPLPVSPWQVAIQSLRLPQ
eukprot:911696-Rhodomonas_salina.1